MASRCPSGLNATPITPPVWPVSGAPIGWPVSASHSRTVPSALARGQPVPVGAERHTAHRAGVAGERGADRLAGVGVPQPHRAVVAGGGQPVPVGAERHTGHRVGVAGERGADGWPVAASHSRTVSSSLAEASRCPSGLNATPHTAPVWPVSGAPIGWPVAGSHSRTVPSALAEASRCPSGLNATPVHRAGVAGERGADRLAGAGVPQPHRVVVAGGGQPVPVGAERHTATPAGVAGERGADRLAGVGVPQPHRVVVAGAWPAGARRG